MLENAIEHIIQNFNDDTEWLMSLGWYQTDKLHCENEFKTNLWKGPNGEECVHSIIQFSKYQQAIDVAYLNLIKENGWHTVKLYKFKPNHLSSEMYYLLDDMSFYYQHPKTYGLYSFIEAGIISRYYNNDEFAFLAENNVSKKTKEIQSQLSSKKFIDCIILQFKKVESVHKWIVVKAF